MEIVINLKNGDMLTYRDIDRVFDSGRLFVLNKNYEDKIQRIIVPYANIRMIEIFGIDKDTLEFIKDM